MLPTVLLFCSKYIWSQSGSELEHLYQIIKSPLPLKSERLAFFFGFLPFHLSGGWISFYAIKLFYLPSEKVIIVFTAIAALAEIFSRAQKPKLNAKYVVESFAKSSFILRA